MQNGEKRRPASLLAKASFFCYFIGRQPYSEGILSRAVHGVTFSFALDFLDLTTFLRQILGKIYSSDFLTTFYDNGLWFIPQQVQDVTKASDDSMKDREEINLWFWGS